MRMTTVYLALGANVGDTAANIEQAVSLLAEKIAGIEQAPVYASKAVGYTDQPDFLNTALRGQTELPPLELLKFIKEVEQRVGRVERFRWGPREIDIDIIFYGDQVFEDDGLAIPHPSFRERDFVLKPLCDLEPDLIDPVSRLTVRKLLAGLPAGDGNILS
jgi:2-amino-4-hydroxy-6-hydroxymethyldihydropteridine diphosphokinase